MSFSAWMRFLSRAARVPAEALAFLVGLYRSLVSPFLPPACRFQPTCSEYMQVALRTHGLFRGGFLGVRRLMRCHPGNPGGFDPVPGTYEG
jgi:putative membrane protein insertion efficiency factor